MNCFDVMSHRRDYLINKNNSKILSSPTFRAVDLCEQTGTNWGLHNSQNMCRFCLAPGCGTVSTVQKLGYLYGTIQCLCSEAGNSRLKKQ